MPREPKRDKALRYLAEERVTVTHANEFGIRLSVRGSRAKPYLVAYGKAGERVITECSCFNGAEVHTIVPRCSHVEVAKLLYRI